LPCVCTRQRTFGHFVVCIHTAKRQCGASLCSLVACCVPGKGFAVRVDGRCTTKIGALPCGWWLGARQRLLHGRGSVHGNDRLHGRGHRRTAMIGCTAEGLFLRQRGARMAEGIGSRQRGDARQRLAVLCWRGSRQHRCCRHCRAVFVVRLCTTTPLPCE
jgi:hypothetical protein